MASVLPLIVLLPQSVHAVECMDPPVTEELVLERLCDVTAAFTAFVASYEEIDGMPHNRVFLNVEVTEVFKGKSIRLNRVLDPGYTGPHLRIGEEALIFAYEVPLEDYIEIRSCSVSGSLSRTSKYLVHIREAMSDYDNNCSKHTRDARAEVLLEQSKENMRRITDRQKRRIENSDDYPSDSTE